MADIPNQPEPGAIPNNLSTGQATVTTVAAQIVPDRDGENTAVTAELVQAGSGAAITKTSTVKHPAVKPGSLSFGYTSGGAAKTITDNGSGVLGGDGSGTITYATGAYTVTTSAVVDNLTNLVVNYTPVGIRDSIVITNTAENVDLTRSFAAQVVAGTTAVATGDGQLYVLMPSTLNGWNLVRAEAAVVTAGTGAGSFTEIQLHNVTDSTDMLSTKIKIAAGSTVGAVGVVDNGAIATNDVIRVDVDAINTGAPQGLMIVLEFQAAAGANTIYVGTSTAQNFAIQGGQSIVIDSTAAIFAKTTTGTATLSFAETYFTTG